MALSTARKAFLGFHSLPLRTFDLKSKLCTASQVRKLLELQPRCGQPVLYHVYCTESNKTDKSTTGTEVDVARKSAYEGLSAGQKVKEVSKDFTYIVIILAAIGCLGGMLYVVGNELFSGNSPNGVYTKAFKICSKNDELKIILGSPIKGHGEESRRGRRNRVSHTLFKAEDGEHMRMMFHLQGPDKSAQVQLDVVKDASGKFRNYRYMVAKVEQFPYQTVLIEDNR